jgi:phosphate transport system permease protein
VLVTRLSRVSKEGRRNASMTDSAQGVSGFALTLEDLKGSPARRRKESLIRRAFQSAAGLSVVISALIVISLVGEAWTFISNVDLGALLADGWFPRNGRFDIRTIVAGTLVIAGIAMVVATPLGLGAAVYLSEYAKPRVRRKLKPILELLATIPSVVLGFFAITWISPVIVQKLFPTAGIFSMAAAGIAVGVLVTPLVASVAEDALRAVPTALREAAFGLGSRKKTATLRIVFPAAISGIVASLILGISRAIGETMIVAMAAGATGGSAFTINPAERGQTMTAAMTALAIGSDRVRGADYAFQSLFFVGLLLFVLTLLLNLASEAFVRRARQKY